MKESVVADELTKILRQLIQVAHRKVMLVLVPVASNIKGSCRTSLLQH